MITGTYVVKSGGEIIGEYKNMLTANGLYLINQFLTGQSQFWADSLAVGALSSVSTSSSTASLQYEMFRYPVIFKTYQTVSGSNQILFKVTVDPLAQFQAYELGLFPSRVDTTLFNDHFSISSFSEFDSGSSKWYVNSTPASTASSNPSPRNGSALVRLTVSTSSTTNTATINNLTLGTSRYTQNDYIGLLYYCASAIASTASIIVTLADSGSTQYTWTASTTVASAASGNFYSALLPLGAKPDAWTDPALAASVQFYGTSGSVHLDHIKFVLGDTLIPELQLVSRTTSSAANTPLFTKSYSQPMDIEYYIQVT